MEKDVDKLLERISSDPLVVGGQPVVRGTRITVDQVIGLLGSGVSRQEIGEDLGLTDEDIRACVAFAREALKTSPPALHAHTT